jgi:hypothetical protein
VSFSIFVAVNGEQPVTRSPPLHGRFVGAFLCGPRLLLCFAPNLTPSRA